MPIPLRITGRAALLALILGSLSGCSTAQIPPPGTLLTENQTRNLILHPRRWFNRTLTLQVYPYDFGRQDPQSYRLCFETCDETRANRGIALLDTRPDRFSGYRGDRAAIVTARFVSNCAGLPDANHPGRTIEWCPDLILYRFIEAN